MFSVWINRIAVRLRLKKSSHKFKRNDVVIFVNDFGVVFRWTIETRTTWEKCDGQIINAYYHYGTDTPWYPTEEHRLRRATKSDRSLSWDELQTKYGFTPTEWFGCY